MRHTVRAFAVALSVFVLSSSLPAFGAEMTRDRSIRERPSPILIIKRIVKRLFGISSETDLSEPHP